MEFKEGKRHVRHSDEMENWSLGTAMEFRHQHEKDSKPSSKGVHKQVDTQGKSQVGCFMIMEGAYSLLELITMY